MGWLGYVLVFVGVTYGLVALGVLAQIATALQRIAGLMATEAMGSAAITQAQISIATTQRELVQQQTSALGDQARYREEQRQHMAVCAKRYEAIMAGVSQSEDATTKH